MSNTPVHHSSIIVQRSVQMISVALSFITFNQAQRNCNLHDMKEEEEEYRELSSFNRHSTDYTEESSI